GTGRCGAGSRRDGPARGRAGETSVPRRNNKRTRIRQGRSSQAEVRGPNDQAPAEFHNTKSCVAKTRVRQRSADSPEVAANRNPDNAETRWCGNFRLGAWEPAQQRANGARNCSPKTDRISS